ncbi:MAG: GCN5-related N-acetyltransferase [Blastococcus sp.]|jgi:GNAT superfamily N-acetyltransferase|nr:GCN5-related N-acetyltransferase [Blastococcus sp.]
MCTSADPSADRRTDGPGRLRDGAEVTLRALPYDDPLSQYLVEQVQQEYIRRYGGRDAAVVEPGEFLPPRGVFLVAEVDGVPAGCGAWRAMGLGPDGSRAEIKRVYVESGFRRRGLARLVVAALEADAARAGHRWVVLNSGQEQPEALALYAGRGYVPVPGYGVYACAPDAVFLGKELPASTRESADTAAGADPAGEERTWAS